MTREELILRVESFAKECSADDSPQEALAAAIVLYVLGAALYTRVERNLALVVLRFSDRLSTEIEKLGSSG